MRAVSSWSSCPTRSESKTATGRAPIEIMSRTTPPIPVAAPWKGSKYDGELCDSTLNVTAQPSPRSTTPAFSPRPTSMWRCISSVVFSPNWRRWTFEDLYEVCSDHMDEYMASSASVGRRPKISRIRWYSSECKPSSAQGCVTSGVSPACATVSSCCCSLFTDHNSFIVDRTGSTHDGDEKSLPIDAHARTIGVIRPKAFFDRVLRAGHEP